MDALFMHGGHNAAAGLELDVGAVGPAAREAERCGPVRSADGETNSSSARTSITTDGAMSFIAKGASTTTVDPSQVSNVDKKLIEKTKFSKSQVTEVNRNLNNNITFVGEQKSSSAKYKAIHDKRLSTSTKTKILVAILVAVVVIALIVDSILSCALKMKDKNQEQATESINPGSNFPPHIDIESFSPETSSVTGPHPTTQNLPLTSVSLTTQRTSNSVPVPPGLEIKVGGTREEGASDQILYLPSLNSDQECEKPPMPFLPKLLVGHTSFYTDELGLLVCGGKDKRGYKQDYCYTLLRNEISTFRTTVKRVNACVQRVDNKILLKGGTNFENSNVVCHKSKDVLNLKNITQGFQLEDLDPRTECDDLLCYDQNVITIPCHLISE